MVRPKKVVKGIGLYPQDWDRLRRNLKPDEHLIELIQHAIVVECEIREGKRLEPRALTSLNGVRL